MANAFRLEGRRVMITGGTCGIGAGIAKAVAAMGADVLLVGFDDDDQATQTVTACERYGVHASACCFDLSKPASVWLDQLLHDADLMLPNIDTLDNNAGTFVDRPFLEMTPELYEATMNLNVAAGYFLTQAFAKRWIRGGVDARVVFTGSINGFLAEPDHTAYDTSKGAIASMVRSLCVALAPHRIRVNSVAPGLIRTRLTSVIDHDVKLESWMKHHTPNGQIPGPESIAGSVVFLLSDPATHVHGQTLLVDGGMSAWQQPDPI
ncbi:MAG: SDR family oxidoreductase [Planctomycetota bacterium]